MGYAKGLGHGLALGLAIGVLTAPRAGSETRQRIAQKFTDTRERSQRVSEKVQQGWQIAQPTLDRASQAAGGVARAVQPVAQGATERFVELVGRGEKAVPPAVPGIDHQN
ncbi:MAG TPA: YtxH domain-containing protein [Candidatus Micrarchaeaceae archaeon]|nr:YtxH domain-containing protein [Candidatus Micrarchaeaceae archaeon]